jgi:hypothetical protein
MNEDVEAAVRRQGVYLGGEHVGHGRYLHPFSERTEARIGRHTGLDAATRRHGLLELRRRGRLLENPRRGDLVQTRRGR